MDVAYTFDATILHEMTHAVPNAATEDAGGKGDSYGWKNCNKMTNSGGTKNADTYSFFGLGARMSMHFSGTFSFFWTQFVTLNAPFECPGSCETFKTGIKSRNASPGCL
jgi:hypothetical protein